MNKNFFTIIDYLIKNIKWIKRCKSRRLRKIMRGYRNLKKEGRLDSISNINRDLTGNSLNVDRELFLKQVFGAGIESAELITRQYLLIRIGGLYLNSALLIACSSVGGKVVHPLPPQWKKIIQKHGFNVSHFRSDVLWYGYIIGAYFYGLMTMLNIILSKESKNEYIRRRLLKRHVYFCDMAPNNIPKSSKSKSDFNIINWYLQWDRRRSNIDAIHHGVQDSTCYMLCDIDIVSQKRPIPSLCGINELFRYFCWSLSVLFACAFDLLRGRYWNALMLNQSSLAAVTRIVSPNLLAEEYFFHNSNWIYRPLWTYEVASCGKIITLYFYSTNCEGFKLDSLESSVGYGYEAMNWQRYLVWNECQEKFVRRVVGQHAETEVVGFIWFSDNADVLPYFQDRSLAVFDVQPMRDSIYQVLALDYDYYTPAVVNLFLSDIMNVAKKLNYLILHKRKRTIGLRAHPKYRSKLSDLEGEMNYLHIDPDFSASKLIDRSAIIISMPFTSTAHLGIKANKPSIFYDALCVLPKDHPAAHGISIIHGHVELEEWLSNVFEDKVVIGLDLLQKGER